MSFPSNSIIKPSPTQISYISENGKQKPFLYSNSSTKIDQCEFEVQKIREKYQKEFNKFYRDRHQRSKSQMQKLERIIQDASDLNEILNDADKWLQKRKSEQVQKQKQETSPYLKSKSTRENNTVKWKSGRKIDL